MRTICYFFSSILFENCDCHIICLELSLFVLQLQLHLIIILWFVLGNGKVVDWEKKWSIYGWKQENTFLEKWSGVFYITRPVDTYCSQQDLSTGGFSKGKNGISGGFEDIWGVQKVIFKTRIHGRKIHSRWMQWT